MKKSTVGKSFMMLCLLAMASLASAASIGDEGYADLFYVHYYDGYPLVAWQQMDQSNYSLSALENLLYGNSGDFDAVDFQHTTGVAVNDWDGDGNADMAYVRSRADGTYSDVRLQSFDSTGSAVGTNLTLEANSADGYIKQYTGIDVGVIEANGNVDVLLAGINGDGNSTIFRSSYSAGGAFISQTELYTFSGDIGIGGLAFADTDGDGTIEVFYVTTTGGLATISMMSFDISGPVPTVVATDSDFLVIDLSSWSTTWDCTDLSIEPINASGDLGLLTTWGQPYGSSSKRAHLRFYDMSGTLLFNSTLVGNYWVGGAIANLDEELAEYIPAIGDEGYADLFYVHYYDGYPLVAWQQMAQSNYSLSALHNLLYGNSGDFDASAFQSTTGVAVNDWDGDGNADMAYVRNKADGTYSDVRLQSFDSAGNAMGNNLTLEASSVEGYIKKYTGIDVGVFKADGNVDVLLAGVNGDGNSTIFRSSYSADGAFLSQTELYTFSGDIGIGGLAFADTDGDGTIEVFYVTTTGGLATISMISFDVSGSTPTVVATDSDFLIIDLSSWSTTWDCTDLSIEPINTAGDLGLLTTWGQPYGSSSKRAHLRFYDMSGTLLFNSTLVGNYWVGGAIANLDEELATPVPELEDHKFVIFWYDRMFDVESATQVPAKENTSANALIPYDLAWRLEVAEPIKEVEYRKYLNLLASNNMTLFVDLKQLTNNLTAENAADIEEMLDVFIGMFDSHPAIKGYYIADEPAGGSVPVSNCEAIYNMVKARSSKPVSICFTGNPAYDGNAVNYSDAYDTGIFFSYPFWSTELEFAALDDGSATWWGTASWKTIVVDSLAEIKGQGKKAIAVVQAFGNFQNVAEYYRLPSEAEVRFTVYYAIVQGAEGIGFYSNHRLQDSPAETGRPYSGDGPQWSSEIAIPLTEELEMMQNALGEGNLDGIVSDNNADVISQIFQDPETEEYFLIAVNQNSGSENVTFTLNFEDGIQSIKLMGQTGQVSMSGTSFSAAFTDYETQVYQIVLGPLLGDANLDGSVDVGDLGILAANYGTTSGATWAMGDFTGDGMVDVGDLGVLAANYGSGSSSAGEFDADYAKVFGTTSNDVDDSDEGAEETFSSICSSFGLPLIAGLVLLGLMLVKLEE